jgi:hypothetical protein
MRTQAHEKEYGVKGELEDRGKVLEDTFCQDEDSKVVKERRAALEKTKQSLSRASGMTDDAVLDKMVELGIAANTVTAMSLVPLVEVAWADGKMDEREKEAILHGAQGKGIEKDSPAFDLLSSWLETKPDERLLDAWTDYIHALDEHLTAEQRKILKRQVIDRARGVAEAAGGFLGMRRISKAEEEILARLAAAFDH